MFYVYRLIDPRNGKPFYIGKGYGRRMHAHLSAAKRGKPGRKCDVIREIIADGHNVLVEKVREFESEEKAFAYERKLIDEIGLDNLTNSCPGGTGGRIGSRQDYLDTDLSWARIIRLFLINSNGFKLRHIKIFGERIELPQSLFDSMSKNLAELYRKKGAEWFKQKVNMTFANEPPVELANG